MKTNKVIYDTIIIGAGPSGVQAGLYLLRAGKKVLFFHDYSQGALLKADKISNFYGQGDILGIDLYKKGIADAMKLGAEFIESFVTHIEYDFELELYIVSDNVQQVKAKTIILAMGKQITVNPSYKINATSKVSYCSTCDGFFFRNKKLAVVGNSEYTLSEFNHLRNVASDITVLTNDNKVHGCLKNINKLITKKISNISLTKDEKIKVLFNDKSNEIFDGVFIAEGHFGTSALANTLGVYCENGFVVVNEQMSTNVAGVFACGDIIGGTFQIAKAVNDGMQTGLSVIAYLNDKYSK